MQGWLGSPRRWLCRRARASALPPPPRCAAAARRRGVRHHPSAARAPSCSGAPTSRSSGRRRAAALAHTMRARTMRAAMRYRARELAQRAAAGGSGAPRMQRQARAADAAGRRRHGGQTLVGDGFDAVQCTSSVDVVQTADGACLEMISPSLSGWGAHVELEEHGLELAGDGELEAAAVHRVGPHAARATAKARSGAARGRATRAGHRVAHSQLAHSQPHRACVRLFLWLGRGSPARVGVWGVRARWVRAGWIDWLVGWPCALRDGDRGRVRRLRRRRRVLEDDDADICRGVEHFVGEHISR